MLKRGFTGHEHLDDVSLVHMNGRVYAPNLGRFISADPTVQFPKYGQSLNRYSYVLNNPLSLTDPSGFNVFAELTDFHHSIDPISRNLDNIVAKSTTLQQIGGVAAAVAAVYCGQPWIVGVYQAHITNIKGGSTGDIVKAGAIAAGAAYAAQGTADWGPYAQFGANVAIGTAAGVASGGDFDSSFYVAAVTAGFSPAIDGVQGNTASARVARIVIASAIGGTASEISGGKFVNGAQTAAFLYTLRELPSGEDLYVAFDQLLNPESCKGNGQWVRVYGNSEKGKYLFSIILSAHAAQQSVSPKLEACDDRGRAILTGLRVVAAP